jgi:hypothetical protein
VFARLLTSEKANLYSAVARAVVRYRPLTSALSRVKVVV